MKKIMIMMLAVLLLLSFVGCNKDTATAPQAVESVRQNKSTTKTDEIPEEYKEVITKFNNTYDYKMPYFGGWKFSNYQVVVFNPEKQTAVLWNADLKRETKNIDFKSLDDEHVVSSYSKGEVNGIKTIFVMLEDLDTTFSLAVHEGYHFYGQDWLQNLGTYNGTPRGTLYPENVQARSLMNQIDYFIKSELNGTDKDGVKKAVSFINDYQNNFKDDLKNNLDTTLAEGTANFVEMLYKAVSNNPELIGDDAKIAQEAFKLDRVMLQEDMLDKGMEYYKAGSSPLFYMAANGEHKNVDEVLKGISPIVTLAKGREGIITKGNEALLKMVSKAYESSNQTAKETIDAFAKQAQDSNKVKVHIGGNAFSGSMEFANFISYQQNGQWVTLNTSTSATGRSQNGGTVEVKNIDTKSTPDYYYELYVNKEDIQKDGHLLTIKNEHLNLVGVSFKFENNTYIID